MSMEIKVQDNGVNARVQLTGRLDAAGVTEVWVEFNKLVETKRGLIVDVSGMTFLTSNGIRMLTAAAKSMTRRGGRVVLLNPSTVVSEVLAVTGMDSIIPIARSEKDAESHLAME
jgi:anti-anti-sigma factor